MPSLSSPGVRRRPSAAPAGGALTAVGPDRRATPVTCTEQRGADRPVLLARPVHHAEHHRARQTL